MRGGARLRPESLKGARQAREQKGATSATSTPNFAEAECIRAPADQGQRKLAGAASDPVQEGHLEGRKDSSRQRLEGARQPGLRKGYEHLTAAITHLKEPVRGDLWGVGGGVSKTVTKVLQERNSI